MSLFKVYARALKYLGAYRYRVWMVVAANIALAMTTIYEPVLFGRIFDAIAKKEAVTPTMMLWAGFAVFSAIAFIVVSREADRLAHGRRASLLTEAFGRIISMPLSWHSQRGTASALNTLLRACEALFGLWLEFMRNHLTTAVALVVMIPTAMAMDLRLSAVLVLLGVFYWIIGRLVMSRTKDGQTSVESHYNTVFSHVSDSISNVSVLHSYNRIEAETKALKSFTERLLEAQYPVLDWWALAGALNRTASTVAMMAILMIGTVLVQDGSLSLGALITFIAFANVLIGRLEQLRNFANQIFEARAKLEDFYTLEDSVRDREEPAGLAEIKDVKGEVEFRDVSFGFANSSQGLHDISFKVKAGQTVAIVGPTGAGKTTLVNLLQRVFDPQKGQILVDGHDITKVTRKSLRRFIATVFQDAGLLNRSISDNIRLGREGATQEEMIRAAQAAAANDFIETREGGYDTRVGERGNKLSGGERQRIAIARAILKDAPILVLDEATSALDVETENRVKTAIDNLRQNRTTFIIAHRLSTVREADMVLFLDNGRIIENGSFNELSQSNGRFAALLRASGILTDEEVRKAHATENEAA
ncbi:glucan ABC transporter ATP-binding protein/ permease [Rhizobium sp. CNPSo 4062]|uniref:glucan ABC transporter ATP-binding protein/ permease n=1 Tax=Rhizobium sp. CNPSo 4062 TaxID=3021410 RepID=UPI00254DC209|nr:glucan ABC transporter ATP-binding protein/ permease [Rhizobium sp. CNPSo 4062]MDK4705441.1 glucan ABC transporter ATP-binding protein/ permease [Rhizobium sp. CNPSo 4062]